MNIRSQRLCAWCGVLFMVLFLVGLLISGFIPPSPAPGGSAHAMADRFRVDAGRIRFGLLVGIFASAFLVPWAAAISVQLARVEGGRFTPLAWTQMILGGLFALEFIIPYLILQSAAYRPERSDEAIQLLIDTGWLMFAADVSTLLLQGVVIGIVILGDEGTDPVFPRWSGYFSIWAAILVSAGGLTPFFKTGPFTWQGLFVWWLPLPIFGAWMVVLSLLVLRAVNRQQSAGDALTVDAITLAARLERSAEEMAVMRLELDRLCEHAGTTSPTDMH
jgi:hypothetical protein